jgi:hypothetical protein
MPMSWQFGDLFQHEWVKLTEYLTHSVELHKSRLKNHLRHIATRRVSAALTILPFLAFFYLNGSQPQHIVRQRLIRV